MPWAETAVRKRRSPSEIAALIEAVYLAQREALRGICGGVPASDVDLGFNLDV